MDGQVCNSNYKISSHEQRSIMLSSNYLEWRDNSAKSVSSEGFVSDEQVITQKTAETEFLALKSFSTLWSAIVS